MRRDAQAIIQRVLHAAQPDTAVKKALSQLPFFSGRLIVVAAGKAAWQMAKAAYDTLDRPIDKGIVITKYRHSKGDIGSLKIWEAGHPVPDGNSYAATKEAIDLVSNLQTEDLVLFLLSGGGSALFEKPLIPAIELETVTRQLLACGADITEINTVRKRLSAVKGGKFGMLCKPARVFSVVLSDIIGDPLDMIASGPAYPDSSTAADALAIADKYRLTLSEQARSLLYVEPPKKLDHVTTLVTGSVRQLCAAGEDICRELGYKPFSLTASLCCQAKEAGSFLASIAQYYRDTEESLAFLCGGETVVHLTGQGKGGRNQELALSAAEGIAGLPGTSVFSLGSDGTDGPTDAAGGYVDGDSCGRLKELGISIPAVLANNDAYHALEQIGGLIVTGPTGTNVNDLTVLLIKR